MKTKLKHVDVWSTLYDGITIEIKRHDGHDKDCWTYYLYIHLDRIPKENNPNSFWLRNRKHGNHVTHDYYKHPIIGEIFLSGGITWYSKETSVGTPKIIKIGCDYGHIWNEGSYNEQILLEDAKKSVMSFRKLVTGYKYWCTGNGKLYDKTEGIIREGRFNSKEYWGEQEWFKKLWKQRTK